MKKMVLASTVLLILGCAREMPVGEAFKSPAQLKLNSAAHWGVLAQHEAILIKKTLTGSSTLPVYINQPTQSSPFTKTYHQLLTSQLANQGVTILNRAEFNAATINYSVEVIKHKAPYKTVRGLPTPLAHGVYYLAVSSLGKGVHDVTTTAIEVLKAPFYAVADQVKPDFATPVEVVITTQIVLGNQVLNSDSNVYYIEEGSEANFAYHAPEPLPHHFKVTDR